MEQEQQFDMTRYSVQELIFVFEMVIFVLDGPHRNELEPRRRIQLLEIARDIQLEIITQINTRMMSTNHYPATLPELPLRVLYDQEIHRANCTCSAALAERVFALLLPEPETVRLQEEASESALHANRVHGVVHALIVAGIAFTIWCFYCIIKYFWYFN
ncbi:uncharacterized protein LOC126748619 [Anthonomus grandis grandis]|uniref:uncharacterized protein LOC126748619 n=1 Tax=Anthonomus grandis grandis TaxID=2921223 RepID=UPI00216661B0|nr:uncharacterized protein LOC126748619 [Anthonomus grandis grandis]